VQPWLNYLDGDPFEQDYCPPGPQPCHPDRYRRTGSSNIAALPEPSHLPMTWNSGMASMPATLLKQFSANPAQQACPAIDRAATSPTQRSWERYRPRFINEQRITGGVRFWQENAVTLARARAQYGVPEEVIVAIIGVETVYGRNTGSFGVLEALATLAFQYPRRADFFRSELEQFLLLTRENQPGSTIQSKALLPAPSAFRNSCRAVSAAMRRFRR
jgi:hypothetical protein